MLFGNPNTAMKTARRDLQTRVWPDVGRGRLNLDWQQLEKVPSDTDEPSWFCSAEHLARRSRDVSERHFTTEALYPMHGQVLDIAMNPSAESMSCAS